MPKRTKRYTCECGKPATLNSLYCPECVDPANGQCRTCSQQKRVVETVCKVGGNMFVHRRCTDYRVGEFSLDGASVEALWEQTRVWMVEHGMDPDAVLASAGKSLAAWNVKPTSTVYSSDAVVEAWKKWRASDPLTMEGLEAQGVYLRASSSVQIRTEAEVRADERERCRIDFKRGAEYIKRALSLTGDDHD